MAIGKFDKTLHNCNGKAKELFNQYCEHFQVTPDEFKGVELEAFYALENFFDVQLFAMSLKEDGSAETLSISNKFPEQNIHECLRTPPFIYHRPHDVLL